MAPMKRERQWDMFDVAIGACQLDDYLNQRYQESDLQSKFWVEKEDRVDELRPPAPGSKQQVLIPIQGPGVTPVSPPPSEPASAGPLPSRPPWEAPASETSAPSSPAWERPPSAPTSSAEAGRAVPTPPPVAPAPPPPVQSPSPPQEPSVMASQQPREVAEPDSAHPLPPPAPLPPDMSELLARFHQAAQDYEKRTQGLHNESSGEQSEPS